MRKVVPVIWLLLVCFCMPRPLSAQSQPSNNEVSVRELLIPPKAFHAFEQGLELMAKKDPAGSLRRFQSAISEYAGYYEAYDRIGAADLKLWRITEAEQAFRKSIEVSGGQYAHPLLALGAILDTQKNFAEAMTVIRKGLDLEPDSWTGHYYQGMALFGLDRLEEAELSLREALRLKADFPEAHLLLADIHSREANYTSLVGDLNEYLKLAPTGPASDRVKALRESAKAKMSAPPTSAALAQPQH
jgi:tetratricopeptide (TPR) repeat protein